LDELIQSLTNLDPSTIAVGTGAAGSVAGMTQWVTNEIESLGLKDKLYRFYPVIPFIIAFIVGYATDQNLTDAIKDCIAYGSAAIAMHNLHETTVQGK
jgi:hypothetical protein